MQNLLDNAIKCYLNHGTDLRVPFKGVDVSSLQKLQCQVRCKLIEKNTGLGQGCPCGKFPAGTVGAIILLELLVISTVTPHNGRKLQYWKSWWMG